MSTLGNMASLASATSSHLDSACKHIQQCRVSQDHMIQFTKAPHDPEELVRNKYRYCVHKDELVLSVGKCWGKQNGTKRFQNNAYPRVVSNLGQLVDTAGDERSEAEKLIKLMYHHATSIPVRNKLLETFQRGMPSDFAVPDSAGLDSPYLRQTANGDGMVFSAQLPYLYDFGAVGYANTLGWAHSNSGDTMSSVMIGGLRTVTNGDFEVFCGDRIQWYWPFERHCFTKDGRRKAIPMHADGAGLDRGQLRNNLQVDPATADGAPCHGLDNAKRQRKEYGDRQFGQRKGSEKMVALIKPFKLDDENPRLYDWYRVFAEAISSAGPHEKVDIRISRQAV
jgi:hypothetical protein